MHLARVGPISVASVRWCFRVFLWMGGLFGSLSSATGQIQYGAPVPPLAAATDPMIQGPVPSYGAPVYGTPVDVPIYGAPVASSPVPSFWQTNPTPPAPPHGEQNGPPMEGVPIESLDGVEPVVAAIAEPAAEDLVEDVPPYEPVWYNPTSWIGPAWDGSIEVGLNGSSGNSDARSIRTGFDLSRETVRTNWDIDLTYNKNESSGVETQHNALFGSNWDFKMSNPRWTWFTKFGLEYDEFKNFDLRLSLNSGLGYALIDTGKTKFRPRFGSGTSREFGGVDEEWHPEAVFGLDFSRQISSRQKFKAKADYFPRWDDFSDYRLLTDIGWELVLDQVNNLSLKVGVIDRYDSTPNGAKPNDIDYSVLLLWSL